MNLLKMSAEEVSKANSELERAKERGFTFSEAVFTIDSVNKNGNCTLKFVDLIDKAHPTDGSLNWGRQNVSKYYRCVEGKLVKDA